MGGAKHLQEVLQMQMDCETRQKCKLLHLRKLALEE